MSIKKGLYVLSMFLLFSGTASAGECVLHVTRTACPKQEPESYSRCRGYASCEESRPAMNISMCANMAKSACSNSRKNVTKRKKITATFDGVEVENGNDFCNGHPDYPYANSPDCKS